MNNKLYPRLAAENIKKNGKTYIPYIITCILTVAMFYMINSLATNPELSRMKTGGSAMPMVLGMGSVVVGIFAVIFLFYTNSFLMKRRKKEFGLYNILGMGKRHIAKVVAFETLYVAIISLVLGLTVGIAFDKLLYMCIAKIFGEKVSMGFYVSIYSIITVFILFGILFSCILLNSLKQIVLSKPIELLRGGNVGEKEPKTKWIMTVLGVICLAAGYYMAVTVDDMGMAIGIFFIAVILVIIGTYLLFTAGSIFLLKALRKNKRYYYKPKHFISVSGMIYRMKQNAVGLANICILSTMVLVMISCTSALVIGIDDTINQNNPYDLNIHFHHPYSFDTSEDEYSKKQYMGLKEVEALAEKYKDSLDEKGNYNFLDLYCNLTNNKISLNGDTNFEMEIIPVQEHNQYSGDSLSLESDEIYLYTVNFPYDYSVLTIFGKEYRIKGIDAHTEKYSYPQIIFIVKNIESLQEINDNLNIESGNVDEGYNRINRVLQYNITNEEKSGEIYDELISIKEKYGISVIDKASAYDDYMGIYGGLFFLGLFLGTLFIMATILIIYYKQISEGYEDQSRFEIMQKVGMSKGEVKSAIHSQVLCVFFLPLITAGIHTIFAFNLVLKCMYAIGFANVPLYVTCTLLSFLAFAVMYVVIYMITAKTYYKIVSK